MNGLTESIHNFIKHFITDNEYPPTIKEIQDGLEVSSTSLVAYHLDILEAEQVIKRIPKISRGIKLLNE